MSESHPDVLEATYMADRIKPLLAGRPPQVQGAILGQLVAIFVAGHYRLGEEGMQKVIDAHLDLVRLMLPLEVSALQRRFGR